MTDQPTPRAPEPAQSSVKCERCGRFTSRVVPESHPWPGNAPYYVCERCAR